MIVSKYAARLITIKIGFSDIKAFLKQDAVEKNAAFKGWVTEFEFLHYLRYAQYYNIDIEVCVYNVGDENWPVRRCIDFEPTTQSATEGWVADPQEVEPSWL